MTLPSGSNLPPISLGDINTEFGLGTSLNAYRSQLWGKEDNTSGVFSSGAINIAEFYSKQIVAAGSNPTVNSPGGGSVTITPYRTITFTLRGAGGGSGGGGGTTNDVNNCTGDNGSAGSSGGSSSFGSSAWALTAFGGGAGGGGNRNSGGVGSQGSDGSGYDGAVARASGGAGYSNGGAGGGGGKATVTLTNPVLGGTGPTSGTTISYNIGSGGGAGGGGSGGNYYYNGFFFVCDRYSPRAGSAGNVGANGSLDVSWTGQ